MSNKAESQSLPVTGQVLHGILLFSLGVFCMAVMDAGAKWLTATYAVIQLIFFDSLFGSIPMAFTLRKEGFGTLRTRRWYLLIGRGCLTGGTMFFFFTALKHLPLADVTIIFLVAPLLTTLLSALLLKEQVLLPQVIAIIVGLVGAVLIIRPGGVNFQLVMLLPLAAATLAALGLVASKVLVRTESSSAIVVYELLVLFCVSVIWIPQTWITPAALDWPIIALIGIAGSLCVYYRTRACEYSPLSVLAPFEYTGMIWAILFGFVIWSELPDMWGWFGAALIAASGVYVTRQQKD